LAVGASFLLAELEVQAIFRRRRHQPRSPPPAKIRPGKPAPTIEPGTGTGIKTIYAGAQLAKQVDPSYTNFVSPSISSEDHGSRGNSYPRLRGIARPWGRCVSPGACLLIPVQPISHRPRQSMSALKRGDADS